MATTEPHFGHTLQSVAREHIDAHRLGHDRYVGLAETVPARGGHRFLRIQHQCIRIVMHVLLEPVGLGWA